MLRSKPEKNLPTLPPSSDKEFWGEDAQTEVAAPVTPVIPTEHKLIMRGPTFVCVSCPFEHTVGLDPHKWTLDRTGQLVKKENVGV